MRGYSLLELMVALLILGMVTYLAIPASGFSWEKDAVFHSLVRARWASIFRGEKIRVSCGGNSLFATEEVHLKLCKLRCSPMIFHPSGFVTPAGSVYLTCGGRKWRFAVSALGRIRILELRTKKAMGD